MKISTILYKSLKLLFLTGLIVLWQSADAQYNTSEMGFESGNLTGWTTAGSVVATGQFSVGAGTNEWTILPADNYMARISPSGTTPTRDQASETLTGSSTALRNYSSCFFADNTTNYGYIYRDISMSAGESITMHWNYVSQDYCSFNDGVFATFWDKSSSRDIRGLAATCDGCGISGIEVTGSYGSTGWKSVTFTASSAGTYRIGFGAFNHRDTAANPILAVDNAPGGTSTPQQPVVSTTTPSGITNNSAVVGGSVSSQVHQL